jgi:signal recognition particle receptor subunit beta
MTMNSQISQCEFKEAWPVSEIINALKRLNQSLEKLESAAVEQENRVLQINQQDLFSAGAPPVNQNATTEEAASGYAVDPALVARKLDLAIEKVEKLLREAS